MAEETPIPETPETPVDESAEMSIAEFEAQYGEGKRVEPDPEPETEDDTRRPQRQRDDQGKFVKPEKPEKHRAKSQEAGPKDVPRIAELTRRLREAEAERDRLKATPPPAAAVAATPPTPPETKAAPPTQDEWKRYKAMPGFPDLKKFEDYSDFQLASQLFVDNVRWAERQQVAHEQAKNDRELISLSERGKAEFPDWEAVAINTKTDIPEGGLIDRWIRENRNGQRVLYWLQKEPQELRRILALELFDQAEALTLLGQRTGQPPREPAVGTGAAATTPVKVAPRPPTPVRTAAPTAPDEPPDPETASLAEFERYYHPPRR